MFDYQMPEEFIQMAKENVERTPYIRSHYSATNKKENRIWAIAAELLVKRLLGLPEEISMHPQIDFEYHGKTYDVKTVNRRSSVRSNFGNNLFKQQEYYQVDRYIFCSINMNTGVMTLCGWLPKDKAWRDSKEIAKGSSVTRDDDSTFDCIQGINEVRVDQLFNCNSPIELRNKLRR